MKTLFIFLILIFSSCTISQDNNNDALLQQNLVMSAHKLGWYEGYRKGIDPKYKDKTKFDSLYKIDSIKLHCSLFKK